FDVDLRPLVRVPRGLTWHARTAGLPLDDGERQRGFGMFRGTRPLGGAGRSSRALIVVALLAGVGWSAPALAQCGGTQLCAPGAGDCTVAADCTITVPAAGLTIDLGARKLVITKMLTFAGGESSNVVINAGSFLLDGGTILSGGANQIAGNVTINLQTNATIQNNG